MSALGQKQTCAVQTVMYALSPTCTVQLGMSALLPKASSRSSGGIRLSRRVRLSARFDEAARRSLALHDHHVPAEACERQRARVVGEDDAKLRESAEVLEDEAFPAAKRPADHANFVELPQPRRAQ